MAKISKDEFISAIAEMTVTEIAELISAMEEKFGVTAAVAAAPATAGGAAAGGAAAAEEKTEFTIIIKSSDPAKKIAAIKEVRAITNLGLKEAKDMVEAPNSTVKEGVSKEDAAKFKAALEAAGCVVELK